MKVVEMSRKKKRGKDQGLVPQALGRSAGQSENLARPGGIKKGKKSLLGGKGVGEPLKKKKCRKRDEKAA